MDQVYDAIDSCIEANQTDIQKLKEMAAVFKTPASLFVSGLSNVWVNIVDITVDINDGR